MSSYNEIMNEKKAEGGAASLKARLIKFRKWSTKQAGITVHGALCVVNGEATDGTRNAPILTFEPQPAVATPDGSAAGGAGGGGSGGVGGGTAAGGSAASGGKGNNNKEARCGAIDQPADRAMYDRTIGCQVRTVRELKKDEVALSVPLSAMITPDVISVSDAGQAVLQCMESPNLPTDGAENESNFWDAFDATNRLEKVQAGKTVSSRGPQLLVKILQERKKAETALAKAEQMMNENGGDLTNKLAAVKSVSYRAPYLAFLIHQRFANEENPPVGTSDLLGEMDVVETFSPYARTLPCSVCVPICWKRNELALLAGCIPGMPALQKVAAQTMQLAAELMALVDAGLLWRFPSTFSPGMITWDRWVWAAAVFESRALPSSSLPSWVVSKGMSSSDVWESCGVMVPFLDMVNHENDADTQIEWSSSNSEDEEDPSAWRLRAITQEKTKKHLQIYRNYGSFDNESFMMKYGIAKMSNTADKVKVAWALVDGVGGVEPPKDYEPVSDSCDVPSSQLVFDSNDADSLKAWWTEQRLTMLGKATKNDDALKKGKKITFWALNNGKIDQALFPVAVVAALPPEKILEWHRTSGSTAPVSGRPLDGLTLDRANQIAVRMYLSFFYAKKLERLLQSLNSCMKDHFNNVQLWAKASSGGLNYVAPGDCDAMAVDGESSGVVMGWQTFFDTYAYNSSMEVEDRYYAIAPDCCALTLYDGHVRSLQNTLDALANDSVFLDNVKQQLEELGCTLDNTPAVVEIKSAPQDKGGQGNSKSDNEGKSKKKDDKGNGNKNRRRDKKDGRPPAIKLHIGNLSYKTLPNQLYDFFTKLYGKNSVLECHIPTERDTGNSRGFGFVTMPEQFANAALESGRSHEMDGRILKVAKSNSAGSARGRGGGGGNQPPPHANDRCHNCGYSPRWCRCNHMGGLMMGGMPPDSIYGPGPYMPPPMGGPYGPPMDMDRMGDGHGWGGGGGGGDWGRRRSYSRSPSYRRDRDRRYRRSRSYSRSRSRSYSRGRDRDDRHRGRHDDDRRRYDDDRRRGSSRRYRSRSRSRSRQRDGAGSPPRRAGNEAGDLPDMPSGGRSRSRSRSRSPNDNGVMDRPSSKKREGKESSGRGGRSRSRDRGSRRRKRSKGSRRGKESSKRQRSRSRSRH